MNLTNIKLTDVPTAFDKIPTDGTKNGFTGEPWIQNMAESHVQGISRYGAHYVLTHNNKGHSKGKLMIIKSGALQTQVDTPDEDYNHPGGTQPIGDFMVVPIEDSGYKKSIIRFADLSQVASGTVTYAPVSIDRPSAGCGCAGITSFTKAGTEYYIVAAFTGGTIDLYSSNGKPLNDPALDFGSPFVSRTLDQDGYQSIALLTDKAQGLWLIGFRISGSKDYMDLWKIDLAWGDTKITFQKSRHMKTKHGGIIGSTGVHFRWGAGVAVTSDSKIVVDVTQRNFVGNKFMTNYFG